MLKKSAAMRVALLGMLTGVMLVLGYVERLLPLPGAVPGMKLGLSNAVLLFALYMLGTRDAIALMLAKVVLSGLLFGGPSAMAFS
ncbi:MAG: Gx transporter family protein, partial [Oscillospiraceae bacterium]|nr:Gx transporter family protein [Oscillospiraceae bacterium]